MQFCICLHECHRSGKLNNCTAKAPFINCGLLDLLASQTFTTFLAALQTILVEMTRGDPFLRYNSFWDISFFGFSVLVQDFCVACRYFQFLYYKVSPSERIVVDRFISDGLVLFWKLVFG